MQRHVPGSLRHSKGGTASTTRISRIVNGLRVLQEDTKPNQPRTNGLFAPNYAADTIYKVSVPVAGSAERMFRLIMDHHSAPLWDAAVESVKLVQELDPNSHVLHIVYRQPTHVTLPLWPLWTRPRDACVTRRWRREQDGSYIVLYQSSWHPDCPETPGVVRAQLHGAGYTIAPRKPDARVSGASAVAANLLTFVVHMDMKPHWVSLAWQRLHGIDMTEDLLMSVLGIRDVMNQENFLSGHLAEEHFLAEHDDSSSSNNHSSSVSADPGGTAQERHKDSPSLEVEPSGTLDPQYFSSPNISGIKVRGPTYKSDKVKVFSDPYAAFELVGVDLFELPGPQENIASRPESLLQRCGPNVSFMFVVQLMVPGPPHLSCTMYFRPGKDSPTRNDGTPFSKLLSEFLDGSDEDRTSRFKVIPRVVEGSWIVKQTVGNTPTILGRKLRQPYHMGPNYIEVDVDIASSSIAGAVLGVCLPVAKSLVVDIVFLLEGWEEEELPEKVLGAVRFSHVDLKSAATSIPAAN